MRKSERKQISLFSQYIPSLGKYKGKDRITSAEYSAYQRAKKKLRHTDNLRPLTEKQAKALGKKKLAGHGIRAVRLRNVVEGDSHSRVVRVTKKGVLVTSNGREWEYHPVTLTKDADTNTARMIEAGRALFARPKKPPFQLHIWTSKGRSNEGWSSLEKWAGGVVAFFMAYQTSGDFVLGIAAMVTDVGGKTRKRISKKDLEYDADEIEDNEEE